MRKLFSISDFAKLSRSSRVALLHYDRVGLFPPAVRGNNKYRYYSISQIGLMNVVRTMQELGMSLKEIKSFEENRTPERTRDIFAQQIEQVDAQIEKWVRARKRIYALKAIIEKGLSADSEAITIQSMPAEPIVQGKLNDYSGKRNDYDALLDFYEDIRTNYPDLDTNYPVWAIFSQKRVRQRDWVWPDRYYMYNPDGYDKKPAGLYAIGYAYGGYGKSAGLYERLLEYIDNSGYEIAGNAYEEYLLNELCFEDEEKYLMRVMIAVQKKNARRGEKVDK